MKVDEALIKRIRELARINLTDKEIKKFKPEFKEILEAFSKLDEVNVDNVKPSFQPVELKNFMREDKIEECLTQEKALQNSENKKDGYFKGPKAV
jgi:aspartyl-tRNA(Asn)/glutamyl-tRNA(Gln) amidotransferase subunit C